MFNFQDFLLYTGAEASQEMKYATIASGVIKYVEETYGIYLSKSSRVFNRFSENGTSIMLGVTPVNSITSITQDSVAVTYTYYGRDIAASVTDTTIPLVITADVGYEEVPTDLKLAVYTHIQSMFFAIENHTTNVSKVVNTTGNTTFFRDLAVPMESSMVYDMYSKRQIALI